MGAPSVALVPASPPVPGPVLSWTEDQKELLKRTIARDTTDDELALFLYVCRRLALDPFARQIYPVKRWSQDEGRKVMAIQVGIDGFRLVAARTGEYEGQTAPQWCGPDGAWTDVWLAKEPPTAARVGVYRRGFREPVYGVALWSSYVQTTQAGKVTSMWAKHGPLMIAKCAEALALRKGFPAELSGVYEESEMMHLDTEETAERAADAAPKVQAAIAGGPMQPMPPGGSARDRYEAAAAINFQGKPLGQVPSKKLQEIRAWAAGRPEKAHIVEAVDAIEEQRLLEADEARERGGAGA